MSKIFLSYIVSGTIILMIFVVPFLVQAADTTTNQPDTTTNNSGLITIANPFKMNSIQGLIQVIVNDILMPIGGAIAVLMIMYAGFLYVTARGNPGKIADAHKALLWGVIGAAILLGAWVISQAIGSTIDALKTP